MPPRSTVWEADPHTIAKHAILRAYLEAWFPILAKWKTRLVYYDGFAGPGRYSQGEEGSPLIALRVAMEHHARLDTELVFVFVEEDERRARHLQTEIDALCPPDHFKVFVINERFETELGGLLDEFDQKGTKLAPTFAFVDPFGITGLPFSLLSRVLKRPQCELLITFMTETLRRFVTELPNQVNDLVGNDDAANRIAEAEDRVIAARGLYADSLHSCASFVRFFELRNRRNSPLPLFTIPRSSGRRCPS